jgi:RNA polymerase sigma factor (sigma-70 family)
MNAKTTIAWDAAQSDRSMADAFRRERIRLGRFIRRRVPDPADAEDILQEVFYELVQAARLVKPVEQVGAWMFRVARNRITDLFRRGRIQAGSKPASTAAGDGEDALEDLLPSADAGPEAAYARSLLLEELEEALLELPEEQRDVFIAHELEGRSFKELAAQSGLAMNTLLSRKHYAVRHLRRRLQAIYSDFVQT